jgi:tRNA/rRNA methyltransferase
MHITDFVSFPLRVVIDVVPAQENESAANARTDKRTWLIERGYRVLAVDARTIEADVAQVLDGLAAAIARQS